MKKIKFEVAFQKLFCYIIIVIEAWLSLVERCVRDAEVVGSNPVASILLYNSFDYENQQAMIRISSMM